METERTMATETGTGSAEPSEKKGGYGGMLALGGLSILAAGGYWLWRRKGRSGYLRKTIRIDRPPQEVYEFWSNLGNLPRFIPHLESVTMLSGKRSRWVAKGPAGARVEWEAETLAETPQEISWKSVEGSQVDMAGTVEFRPASEGMATDLKVTMTFRPVVGGEVAAAIAYPYVSAQLGEDLGNLKRILEGGAAAETH